MDKQRRKELQAQYKQIEIMMGAVQITNTQNGKLYVGVYPDIKNKWQSIQNALDSGIFSSGALVRDWREYGRDAFTYQVLEQTPQGPETPEERSWTLKKLERKWLDKLQPYGEKGYNRKPLY